MVDDVCNAILVEQRIRSRVYLAHDLLDDLLCDAVESCCRLQDHSNARPEHKAGHQVIPQIDKMMDASK